MGAAVPERMNLQAAAKYAVYLVTAVRAVSSPGNRKRIACSTQIE